MTRATSPLPARRMFFIAAVLTLATVLAVMLTPSRTAHGPARDFALDAAIPAAFGPWRQETNPPPFDPVTAARADTVYERTLSRSYVDAANRRVMLSIAYGEAQLGESVQAHRPEYCYKAQGFTLARTHDTTVDTAGARLPVRRLVAQRGDRTEPISYWMTIGDDALLPGLSRKWSQLRYGLAGESPDGLLIRVSSIGTDADSAYALHDAFVRDLVAALPPEHRSRLTGSPTGAPTGQPPNPALAHLQDIAR